MDDYVYKLIDGDDKSINIIVECPKCKAQFLVNRERILNSFVSCRCLDKKSKVKEKINEHTVGVVQYPLPFPFLRGLGYYLEVNYDIDITEYTVYNRSGTQLKRIKTGRVLYGWRIRNNYISYNDMLAIIR